MVSRPVRALASSLAELAAELHELAAELHELAAELHELAAELGDVDPVVQIAAEVLNVTGRRRDTTRRPTSNATSRPSMTRASCCTS